MNDTWHKLTHFESRDLVRSAYIKRHSRTPNSDRIREITASFVQAREYFANAARAAITVRPLLQYYGVAALSRGLVLFLAVKKGPEALKPSHGLDTKDWPGTLAKGLSGIGDLTVTVRKGLFSDLIEATNNTSYFKAFSSGVDWNVEFPHPPAGSEFSLVDIAASMPDVAPDFLAYAGTPQTSAELVSLHHHAGDKQYELKLRRVSKETVERLFPRLQDQLTISVTDSDVVVSFPDSEFPFFGQRSNAYFGTIGAVHIVPTIRGNIYLCTIGLYYAVSYILGMLVRYFPAIWISLGRQEKGDAIFPLVSRFGVLIQDYFPQIVLELLKSPYPFEKEETADGE